MARLFRDLCADEVECRVAQCSQKGCQLLLYKTARTDYALLDEVFGAGWQCEYREVKGNLYCRIGVRLPGEGEWVWRENCGTESNQEAEKGEASDALKRAGTAWGIGRELYTAPFIWVKADQLGDALKQDQRGKWQCRARFEVEHMEVEDGKITALVITDGRKRVYTYGQKPQNATRSADKASPALSAQNALEEKPQGDLSARVQELVREVAALRKVPESTVVGSLEAHRAVTGSNLETRDEMRVHVLETWAAKAQEGK